jgi:hypothetical protein
MDRQKSVPFAFGLNYDLAMFQRNGSANDLQQITIVSVRSTLSSAYFLGLVQ